MGNKRYSDTINPQIAVQDYLDDLLQKLPSTSPLDKLRQEEEDKAAIKAANKKAQQQSSKLSKKQVAPARQHASYSAVSANYGAGRESSIAAQRLEKKRALDRASRREFREPLTLKSSSLLKIMPEVYKAEPELKSQQEKAQLKPNEVAEVTDTVKTSVATEIATNIDVTIGTDETTAVSTDITNLEVSTSPAASTTNRIIEEPLKRNVSEVSERALLQPGNRQASVSPQTQEVEDKTTAPAEDEAYKGKWLENGRPDWAQGRFECLIFTVAGLKLAVPLVSLGAIHTIDQELTPLVGRPDWFLGLLPVGEKNIRVVDSALWIMPERYNEGVKDGYRFVIRLDNSDWGMACDSVAQSFSIAPEEVRWRTDRGKRPWLAGTVIDHMCALMDVAAVAHLLDTAEKTNQSPI